MKTVRTCDKPIKAPETEWNIGHKGEAVINLRLNDSHGTKKLGRNVKKTIEKKRYVRWRHKLHGATEDYFNLDGENAIFVARIGLPLRLQSDNLYGKFLKSLQD